MSMRGTSITVMGETFPLYYYAGGMNAESYPTLVADNRDIISVPCCGGVPTLDGIARAEAALKSYYRNDRKALVIPASMYGIFDHDRFTKVTLPSYFDAQIKHVFSIDDAINALSNVEVYAFKLPCRHDINGNVVFDEGSRRHLSVPSLCVEYVKEGQHLTYVLYDRELIRRFVESYNEHMSTIGCRERLTRETDGLWSVLT